MTRPRGFTLVELVVTMIVVGVLAVVVLPRFALLGGFDAVGFADQLKANLRFAQKTAIAERRLVAISFSTSSALICSRSYVGTPVCATPPAGCVGWTAVDFPGGAFKPGGSSTGVASASGNAFCFDAVGRPYVPVGALAAAAQIEVSDGGTAMSGFSIEPETGYVH